MQVRMAVLLSDEKDRKHLSGVLRRAGLRGDSRVGVVECRMDDADVVLVKASDPLAQARVGNPEKEPECPIVVVYGEASPNQAWTLPWPARTHDVLVLAEQLSKHLAVSPARVTASGRRHSRPMSAPGRVR